MVSHPSDNSSLASGSLVASTLSNASTPYNSHRYRASTSKAPPSVAGTSYTNSSTVRPPRHQSHRYSKSHSGFKSSSRSSSSSITAAHLPVNEFPTFERTGDVEIVLVSGRHEARYLLHRLYLAQCSGFFEDVLGLSGDEEPPGSAGSSGGSGGEFGSNGKSGRGRKVVRFELDRRRGEEMPMLILQPTSSSSPPSTPRRPPAPSRPKPPPPSSGFFRTMANLSALHISNPPPPPSPDATLIQTYGNLFLIFYNHTPHIDSNNIATAYTECKALLQLAHAYDALHVIGPRVDHHLLRFGNRLWKQIAKYPPSYLKLGYLARSRAIFAEALVHVVGQWPAGEGALRGQVPQEVLDLVEDKVDEVDDIRRRVEGRLFRLNLTTSRGERVSPSVAWLDWLVVSLWRGWFAEQTTPATTGILKSEHQRASSSAPTRGGGNRNGPATNGSGGVNGRGGPPGPLNLARVYRLLALGGSAYLPHDEVKRFLKLAPGDTYSRDNLKRAERRLEELKNLARDAVQPLTRNFLELDAGGVGYFTCVRVLEGEWPWDE